MGLGFTSPFSLLSLSQRLMEGIEMPKIWATSLRGIPRSRASSTLSLRSFEYAFTPSGLRQDQPSRNPLSGAGFIPLPRPACRKGYGVMLKARQLQESLIPTAVTVALAMSLILELVWATPARAALPGANGLIAYEASDDAHYQIYTISATGKNPIQVTTDSTDHYSPAFSADGKKIAYEASDGSHYQIYTISATGGTSTQTTTEPKDHLYASFSPDDKTTVY